jgi:hypothetical protein
VLRCPATAILAFALATSAALAQPSSPTQGREIAGAVQQVLPERARPPVVNRVLQERLETLLPRLMREAGLDMWLVITREYVEDPFQGRLRDGSPRTGQTVRPGSSRHRRGQSPVRRA